MKEKDFSAKPERKRRRIPAYEKLLSIIQQQQKFGEQPQDVIEGVANAVLLVLKSEKIENHEKKKEIEELLDPVSAQLFDQIVSLGRMITEEEEKANNRDQEESYEDDKNLQESNVAGVLQMGGIDDDEMDKAKEGLTLDVQDIDTIWLQRKISKAFEETNPKLEHKGLIEVLASCPKYDNLPTRPGEEELLKRLIVIQRFPLENPNYSDPHVKVGALLQAHFSRHVVDENLVADQKEVLLSAHKLIHAMVVVISSNGWLNRALTTIRLSQMVTQGMWWFQDSVFLQLPHITEELAKKLQKNPQCRLGILDLQQMEEGERRKLLQMSDSELSDITSFCSRIPLIDIRISVLDEDDIMVSGSVTIEVDLKRFEGQQVGKVHAPRYPEEKEEGLWLVIGDTTTDELLAEKRVVLQERMTVNLVFTAPDEVCEKEYSLYCLSDSYVGCDQQHEFAIDVKDSGEEDGTREMEPETKNDKEHEEESGSSQTSEKQIKRCFHALYPMAGEPYTPEDLESAAKLVDIANFVANLVEECATRAECSAAQAAASAALLPSSAASLAASAANEAALIARAAASASRKSALAAQKAASAKIVPKITSFQAPSRAARSVQVCCQKLPIAQKAADEAAQSAVVAAEAVELKRP